jgi:predicted nuclease of predicted toxin-antitoxin system
MKFFIDESAPKRLNEVLKSKGHESQTLHELKSLGITNGKVVQYAIERDAILVTCDADFLNFKKDLQRQIKVIYFKVHPRNYKIINSKIDELLDTAISTLNRPGVFTINNSGYEFTPH